MKTKLIGVPLGLALAVAGCHYPTHEIPRFETKNPALAPEREQPKLSQVDLTNQFDRGWLAPSTNLFTLGPGDKLEIELLSEPGSKTTTVVAPDGKIYFNLLPGLDVWGLTLGQARAALERELAKYIRDQPQVSLVLRDVESR